MKQRLAILGSTGSIGVQTLDIARENPGRFEVRVLTANRNWERLARQAREFDADAAVIADKQHYAQLRDALAGTDTKVYAGEEAVAQVAAGGGTDVVVNALVGYAGLAPTVAAIEAGKKLKELSQYFQETAAGDSNDQAAANFYNGEAAILIQGSWAIAQINGNNPDFESKCGVFQFPGIEGANDPNRMIVKTDNLLMSATTEHQDAVIALMKMFTDETAQKYTAEIGGKIPIVKDLEIDYDKAPAQLKYVQDILANATGTFGFYNESLASVEAGDCFDNAMVDIFLDNQTPEEAFQTVQTFYEENVWE